MTTVQAKATLMLYGATYVTSKQGVEWFKAQDGSWIAKQQSGSEVVLKKLPANACGC